MNSNIWYGNNKLTLYTNYGDHNFIEITQQSKLRVAPVALIGSSESSRAVRQARYSQNAWARHVERRSTRSTKSNVSSRVETSQVEFRPMLLWRVLQNIFVELWFWTFLVIFFYLELELSMETMSWMNSPHRKPIKRGITHVSMTSMLKFVFSTWLPQPSWISPPSGYSQPVWKKHLCDF